MCPASRFAIRSAVPNAVSLLRLGLGLAFPVLPPPWRPAAVVLAGLTDLLDGAVSRWLHAGSTVGRLLDPLADKVFVLAVVLTLLADGSLSVGEVLLLGQRDLVVLAGAVWVLCRRRGALRSPAPTLLGKTTTAVLFLFLLVLCLDESAARWLFIPTAVLSGITAVQYGWMVFVRRRPEPDGS